MKAFWLLEIRAPTTGFNLFAITLAMIFKHSLPG
jgi:hypothetical protein